MNKSNVVKTLNYIKRNGPVKTFYAIKERLRDEAEDKYEYVPISEETRLDQIRESLGADIKISVLVPAYETPKEYLKALIDSLIAQTYGNWELVIADGSASGVVTKTVNEYSDTRINLVKLSENKGISGNSNEGLLHCTGDYIGLLDHDDLLTADCLYEVAKKIRASRTDGIESQLLYTNEDKTNAENTTFYEANIKPKFNLDLLLSNNYICHFLVVKSELAKEVKFRSEYDGAQDHDFILRCTGSLQDRYGREYEKHILNISKVLYHWRCHESSTALNPTSKLYAYEAGKRAVSDYLAGRGMEATVSDLPHMGFFRVDYEPDIFTVREDVCALGCRILDKNGRVKDGVYDENGDVMFKGLSRHDSGGRLHRASCRMEVPYISVLGMLPNAEAEKVFKELLNREDSSKETDYKKLSMEFCNIMKSRGYRFVYDPDTVVKGK
ncbi:MAG: glycosyltransferase [Lachnospiraceae bacterium]|nr:glycosyltransferase [Lachnospiraceae bacterium]